jgi:D-alanyl-D-alanine carboxypeptidase
MWFHSEGPRKNSPPVFPFQRAVVSVAVVRGASLLVVLAVGCGGMVPSPPPPLDSGSTVVDAGAPTPDAGHEADAGALFARLQSALEQRRAADGGLGVVAGVRFPDGGTWLGASGHLDAARSRTVRADDTVRIYSITKTMTAALIMQLAAEGRLSVDDPLDRWFPGFPLAQQITLRHLLSHTSGTFDYLQDTDVYLGRMMPWLPDGLIGEAAGHPPAFLPGEQNAYSNTNYLMLGRIAEQVAQQPYGALLRSRLFTPLGLTHTWLEGAEQRPMGIGDGLVVFGDVVHPSVSWSAGAVQSNIPDLLEWFDALSRGRVVPPRELQQMQTAVTLNDAGTALYGLGLVVSPASDGALYGHLGGGAGWDFSCYVAHRAPYGYTVAACATGGGSGTAHANALWRELGRGGP